jgi:hypothetical protein
MCAFQAVRITDMHHHGVAHLLKKPGFLSYISVLFTFLQAKESPSKLVEMLSPGPQLQLA